MNNCNKVRLLMEEIFAVKSEIQTQFPELYVLLAETPSIYSGMKDGWMANKLEYYLHSIIDQLKEFQSSKQKGGADDLSRFRMSFFI